MARTIPRVSRSRWFSARSSRTSSLRRAASYSTVSPCVTISWITLPSGCDTYPNMRSSRPLRGKRDGQVTAALPERGEEHTNRPFFTALSSNTPSNTHPEIQRIWRHPTARPWDRTAGHSTSRPRRNGLQRTLNPQVQGSNPWGRTTKRAGQRVFLLGVAMGLVNPSNTESNTR